MSSAGRALVALAGTVLCLLGLAGTAQAAGTYRVDGVATRAERAAVARTGAAIVQVDSRSVVVTASQADVRALRRAGFAPVAAAAAFPPADGGYHDFAEMSSEVSAAAAAHPGIVSRFSLGTSYEGRQLWAVKVSDNVASDESEPEVLFTAGQHAREHLTIEMALYLLHELADGYGTDSRITAIVNTREIYIVFNLNPDGSEYDIATGTYRSWRKNRQPNGGSSAVGTDLNRNWSYRWGCCGGSSSEPCRRDLPRRERRSRRPRRSACATLSTAAWSAACSRSARRSTFTPTPSSCCGRTASRPPTPLPA